MLCACLSVVRELSCHLLSLGRLLLCSSAFVSSAERGVSFSVFFFVRSG